MKAALLLKAISSKKGAHMFPQQKSKFFCTPLELDELWIKVLTVFWQFQRILGNPRGVGTGTKNSADAKTKRWKIFGTRNDATIMVCTWTDEEKQWAVMRNHKRKHQVEEKRKRNGFTGGGDENLFVGVHVNKWRFSLLCPRQRRWQRRQTTKLSPKHL